MKIWKRACPWGRRITFPNRSAAALLGFQDASDKLEVALSESNQANKAKSAFIANMSHEIRTPLNSIIGFSALAALEKLK